MLQQQILTGILNECRRAKYFSVMIDETKDIACHKQISLFIRFADEKSNVFEKFVGFERTATITGEALADTYSISIYFRYLCLIDVSTRVPSVRDTFSVVSSLYKLIEGSLKRHHVFEHVQK